MHYGDISDRQQSASLALILLSFFLSIVLEFFPWPIFILQYKPLFPVLALVYWVLYGSRWVGYTAAIVIGILIDLSTQSPAGFNIASCSVIVFLTSLFSSRFALFGGFVQAMHVFFILALGQLTWALLGWFEAFKFPTIGWRLFIPSLSAALLWLILPLCIRKLRELISGSSYS